MASLITGGISRKGKPLITDNRHYSYNANGSGVRTENWPCSTRKCPATITTRKSTGNLVGEVLPDHNHGYSLLKMKAQETEKEVLAQYAEVEGAVSATVLQEIGHRMLGSDFPGQLNSASSAGAIRMKLWRQRQVFNPRPKLPSSFKEYMATEIPDKFTKAADGGEFMVYKVNKKKIVFPASLCRKTYNNILL